MRSNAITLNHLDRENCSVTFDINDQTEVDRFLTNTALINFLTDRFTGGEDCGCRIRIEQRGTQLVFSRQLGVSTMKSAANIDLAATLLTYVVPNADIADKADIWIGMSGLELDRFEPKTLSRGVPFAAAAASDAFANSEEIKDLSRSRAFP